MITLHGDGSVVTHHMGFIGLHIYSSPLVTVV